MGAVMTAPAKVERVRKPDWIRVKAPTSVGFAETKALMRAKSLNTVCEEAACPNIGECWTKKHATVMILGDVCTRACAFCNVKTGMPRAVDKNEPQNLADAAAEMGLKHIVITSVDRDDLPDGGASQFVKVIEALRRTTPETTIEILTPDFRNKMQAAVESIVAARPDVYNHNLETVPRLYPTIRPGRALLCLAPPAGDGEASRSDNLHEVRHHGRPWGTAAGSSSGDGRHALCRHRFPDHRPISSAHAQACRGERVRHTLRRLMPMRRSRGPRVSCWLPQPR